MRKSFDLQADQHSSGGELHALSQATNADWAAIGKHQMFNTTVIVAFNTGTIGANLDIDQAKLHVREVLLKMLEQNGVIGEDGMFAGEVLHVCSEPLFEAGRSPNAVWNKLMPPRSEDGKSIDP